MKHITPVILAAGASSRFNGNKLLAKISDKMTILDKTLDTVIRSFSEQTILVTRNSPENIREKLNPAVLKRIQIIENKEWKTGISSSIRIGIDGISLESDCACIFLADQVTINVADIHRLKSTFYKAQDSDTVVCSSYESTIGVPSIFPKRYFPDLKDLQGDCGAKAILQSCKNKNKLISIEIENASIDIDTREDLRKHIETTDGLIE